MSNFELLVADFKLAKTQYLIIKSLLDDANKEIEAKLKLLRREIALGRMTQEQFEKAAEKMERQENICKEARRLKQWLKEAEDYLLKAGKQKALYIANFRGQSDAVVEHRFGMAIDGLEDPFRMHLIQEILEEL